MESLTPVSDIQSWILFPDKNGKGTFLVGSIELDKYIVVSAEQYPIVTGTLELLREGHSPDRIQAILLNQGISTDVGAFCRLLAEKGLVVGEQLETPKQKKRWADLFGHLRTLSWEVFSIPLESLHGLLDNTAHWFLPLLTISVVLSTLAVLLWGDLHWSTMREMARFSRQGYNMLLMLGINGLAIPFFVLTHEITHAIFAARGRVYPRRLSFRWFLTVPYFSLQLPGLYTLPYGTRLVAIAGGPLADLLTANLTFLLARIAGIPWLWLMTLLNYSRFFFNVLPILPMTDGYALLSQAVFREIDIRGRAGKEFRRWRQRKPNSFRGKYAFFYLVNAGVAIFILGSGLWQLNGTVTTHLRPFLPALVPSWTVNILMVGIDLVCLYLLRNRLRVLLAW